MSHDVKKAYDDYFIQIQNSDLIHLMKTCKPTTVNVFLALHIRANRKAGNTCFPSLSTIASDANVSRRTAVNAIEELEREGLVTVEKRMDAAGDQTSNLYWLHKRENPARGSAESAPQVVQDLHQGVVQNLHPNHMNSFNTDEIELDSSGDEEKAPSVEDQFDTFWQAYPRKVAKGDARKAFAKAIKTVSLGVLVDSVAKHKKSEQWKDTKYIPHPATWLNGGRWDDEVQVAGSKPVRTAPPELLAGMDTPADNHESARERMIREAKEREQNGY